MGFGSLFASSLGTAAKRTACLIGGMRGWLEATLVTIQAAGPVIQEQAYSALWAEVDSTMELKPLSVAKLRELVWAPKMAQTRAQKCVPASTSRFCKCGGIPGEVTLTEVRRENSFPDCPVGRNLCRHGPKCRRHGGQGISTELVVESVAAPVCGQCNGTGIIPRDKYFALIRECYKQQQLVHARPTVPLSEDVIYEGTVTFSLKIAQTRRLRELAVCSASDWMQAAQIMRDGQGFSIENPLKSYGYERMYAGDLSGDWLRLFPAFQCVCDQVFSWWHSKNTPGWEPYSDSLSDFVKPRYGQCSLPIVKESRTRPTEHQYQCAEGSFDYFTWCVDGLRNSMEEFLEVFYDCAAQFDGELELILDGSQRPTTVSGALGGVHILLKTPSVDRPKYNEGTMAALYAELVCRHRQVSPLLMARDQDEIEDQLDHLENKQGGEIIATPNFIRTLKEKRKEVRGKQFVDGAEGRLVRHSDLSLSKSDIFLANSLVERLRLSDIVAHFKGRDPKLTKVCVDLTNQEEIVKFPAKELTVETKVGRTAQVFTVLNRPQYSELNKFAERGWKEAKSVCLNLHIRSYVPVHTPLYAFCVIMWGHSSDAKIASLCGAYCYLGDQEASVLELPLLCSYIGKDLADFEAYKRSLVLSTVFIGSCGLHAGDKVFGITAVEFTEYLPTSYGGITHEKDSWGAMLAKHQGKDKGRFIAGFNVVDALERNKEEPLVVPDINLLPVPRTQPIVRNFGDEKQPHLNKSTSMRVRGFSQSFRAANIPRGVHIDNCDKAVEYELGRASTSGVQAPKRLNGVNLMSSDGEFAFIVSAVLPASVATGEVILCEDILSSLRDTTSPLSVRWLAQGYIDQDFTFICHLADNQFSGVALWIAFDAFSAIPADITTTIELEMFRSLSPHLCVMRDPKTHVWNVDLRRLCGQSLSFAGNGFCNPKLWVVAATSSRMAWSQNVNFNIEVRAHGDRYVRGLWTEQVLTYPLQPSVLEDLDLVLMPSTIEIGAEMATNFTLALAEKQWSKSERGTYSYASGLLSHFLGVGGTMHFSVHVTSSKFVSCKLRVALWGTTPTRAQMCQIPHVDIMDGGEGSLEIQSAYYSTANFGDVGTLFWVFPLCSPMVPEKVESSFEYFIRIKGISANPRLCRSINYKNIVGWFLLENIETPRRTEELVLTLPSRCSNITLANAKGIKHGKITNLVNPFAIMCATTGMQWGKVVLHFQWTLNAGVKLANTVGNVIISQGRGLNVATQHTGYLIQCATLDTSVAVPFEFGSFAGPVISGGVPFEAENWTRFETRFFHCMTTLCVSIEVLDGFQFYGRSAGPMTISSGA